MRPLEVLLFGGLVLRRGGDTVPAIPSRVGRSLFAYLVVNRGTPHARERLVAEFWPDLPEPRGRRRLSHTLWQLQDSLGEIPGGASYLEVATDTLAFAPAAPVRIDVDEFERGLEELRELRAAGNVHARHLGRLEQAIDLYSGEFLDGHYEPWVLAEQERLGQRYLEALSLLIELAKRYGAYDDALLYARRLTHQAPLREDAHREVMRLSMLLGRPAEAIKQYERCVEVLSDELGTDPSASTTQLFERIVRQKGTTPWAPTPVRPDDAFAARTPLVGRDRERNEALSVLESGLGGRGGALLLEGDPGVGKTRLLEEVVEDAEWRGFSVLSTSCGAAQAAGPFGAVRSLLSQTLTPLRIERLRHRIEPVWLSQVARLVPELQRVLPSVSAAAPSQLKRAEGAQRMRDSLVQVLLALSEIDPTLVIVDDVQWADDESLDVLAALSAGLVQHRLALMIGYRTDEARTRGAVWDAMQRVDREARPVRLLLGPLDPFSVGELVRSVARGHHVDPMAISRLQRETGGNPLFVVETLRELAHGGELAGLESDDPSRLPLPGSIRDLVVSRLDRLPRDVRGVLEAAAIAGADTDLDTLASAVELPHATVVEAVDLLVRRSLVREHDGAYGIDHDQVRRTGIEAMSPAGRRAMHRRVGEALEHHRPEEVERLAHHFEAAGMGRRAVGYLRSAAQKAAGLHAYSTADGYYRRAAAQQAAGPASVSARFDLLAEHEDVLDVLGERTRQGELIEELAALAGEHPQRVAEATRRRAMHVAELGDLRDAVEIADHAVVVAGELGDTALRGRALQVAASVRAWMGRREEAVPLWEQAIPLAPTPAAMAESRTMLASVLRELHRYDQAVEHLTAALDIAEESGESREEARALGVLGSIRMEAGDGPRAAELYRRSLDICETIGFRRGQAINLLNLANVLYVISDAAGALEAYDRAREVFASLADPRGSAVVSLNRGYVRHLLVGDDDEAHDDVESALAYFQEAGDARFHAVCRDALAGLALAADDPEEAMEQVELGLGTASGHGDAQAEVQLLCRRAEIALATGKSSDALSDAQAAQRSAESHHLASLAPSVLALLGRAHLARSEVSSAVACTSRAVASLSVGVERPYLVRLAHHDALQAAGRSSEALDAAIGGAAELGGLLDSLDEDLRRRAAEIEPHARLLQIAAERHPRVVTVRVASSKAPMGRPLRDSELVRVRVELARVGGPPDPVDHRRWILAELVEQIASRGAAPTITDLASVLDVSEATIRRDLTVLRGRGESVTTRGSRAG